MRASFYIFSGSVWLVLGLVGCAASPTLGVFSPTPLTLPSPTMTASPLSPLPSDTPAPSPTASPVASSTLFIPGTPTPFLLSLCSPLEGYTFEELPGIESQSFIPNRPGKDDGHQGVDFAHWLYKDRVSLEGAAIQSVLPGVVAAAVADKYPYGNMILVETPYGHLSQDIIALFLLQPEQSLYLLYGHMKEPSPFSIGDRITCGETVGAVGNTGASGNPHLHFETRVGPAGVNFESMEYYKTISTPEERANYERWRFLGDFILYNPWDLLRLGN